MLSLLVLVGLGAAADVPPLEDFSVSLGQSQVLQLPGAASITIQDPTFLKIVPMHGAVLHVVPRLPGQTQLAFTYKDGGDESIVAKVKDKPLKLKAKEVLHTTSRGRSTVFDVDSKALYVGTGDRKIAVASLLGSSERRILVSGAGQGDTDVVVQTKDGVHTFGVRVSLEAEPSDHEVINIPMGGVWTRPLPERPDGVAVADTQVATAKLSVKKEQSVVQVTAVAPGTTDLVVSGGPGTTPTWYTLNVFQR